MNKNIVDTCIRDLLLQVSSNPLIHFSEKALQVRLASKLLRFTEFAKPVPTGLAVKYKKQLNKLDAPPRTKYIETAYSIPPLQMEYGTNDKGPYRIDIAILDPDEIKLINSWQFQRDKKYLDPFIGIEIGTEKTGMRKMSKEHLENDAKKLINSRHAYVLNIIRNTNVCKKDSKSYENKSVQIKKFKDGLQAVSCSYSSIKWIGIVLLIAYQEVEFFDVDNKWTTFTIPSNGFIEALDNKFSID